MARDAGIRKYLDAGSLNLFARQLTESLDNAVCVAVYDTAGEIAWAGPDDEAAANWPDGGFVSNPFAEDDSCVELSNGNFAYSFPLQSADGGAPAGFLLVQSNNEARVPAEEARREVKSILNCIHKQLDIGLELSAVRKQTDRDRADMTLLYELAGLSDTADAAELLPAALRAAGSHFDCDLLVLWMPEQGVQLAWRHDGDVGADQCAALAPIFKRLVIAAQRRRKVLVTDAPGALQKFARTRGDSANILSAPVLNLHDEVAGIVALIRTADFSRRDLRFVRVVSSKLAAFAGRTVTVPKAGIGRHDLLRHVDMQLANDRKASRALLLIDIDKLHVINEMHGHFGGDAAIEAVLAIAEGLCPEGGLACNLAGGSIALYLARADEPSATATADRVRKLLLESPPVYEGRSIETAVSIGIAMMPAVVDDAASALNTAEVASRSAKARGGDQAVVFDDLDASVLRRREDLDQVGELQAALLDNRFVLYAQRIVALQEKDSRPRYEVLLRMVDEDGRMHAPDRFLSAAERYQMMASIDRWVVRQTMDTLSKSDNLLEVNLASFSINVSTQSMMDDQFPGFVEQCILDSGISPDTFCFEITETSAMRNLEKAQDMLRRFAGLGCRLALDDFGTGQCSFAYLKDLPVQYVKIDGTFVRDILENPLSEAIVESIAKIAHVIHARTIAEYVENDMIMTRLRDAEIDFAQGYLIGKPKPLAEVLADFGGAMIEPDEMLSASA